MCRRDAEQSNLSVEERLMAAEVRKQNEVEALRQKLRQEQYELEVIQCCIVL